MPTNLHACIVYQKFPDHLLLWLSNDLLRHTDLPGKPKIYITWFKKSTAIPTNKTYSLLFR